VALGASATLGYSPHADGAADTHLRSATAARLTRLTI
jgi:hypothetical protein